MATMKTLNGYGLNATELNGKTSDNYLLITDTASDSAKLGGKVPEHYLQPRNLLDNSDFTNPVNQRGKTSYTGAGYTIDRWENNSAACKLTVENGCIHMQNNSDSTSTATQFIRQKIENPSALIGKTITIAARVKGNCRLGCEGIGLTYPNYVNYAAWTTITLTVDISAMTDSYIAAVLQGKNKSEWYCSWIALYEGSYTADTLPPYVSKGKHAEMLNCGVSLTPHNLLDNSDFRNPVNQRGITTTDSSFTGYMLDRWIVQNSGTLVTLDSNGLNVAASSGAKYLFQRLNNVKNGKTYTFAAALSNGTIGVCAFTLSSTTSTWEWIKEVHVSSSFQISVAHSDWMPLFVAMSNLTDTSARIIWAALYEGSYTSDTLPPYVSKGYAAELAEFRREFGEE